jgi:predicted nucleic acid-binding protein
LQNDPRATRLLADAVESRRTLVGSVMTRVEVLAGMRPSEELPTHRLLRLFEWVPVGRKIADRAGELGRRYLASHPGVDPVDLVIAATVELLGAELWTRNPKHFPMVSGLRDPYADLTP